MYRTDACMAHIVLPPWKPGPYPQPKLGTSLWLSLQEVFILHQHIVMLPCALLEPVAEQFQSTAPRQLVS